MRAPSDLTDFGINACAPKGGAWRIIAVRTQDSLKGKSVIFWNAAGCRVLCIHSNLNPIGVQFIKGKAGEQIDRFCYIAVLCIAAIYPIAYFKLPRIPVNAVQAC